MRLGLEGLPVRLRALTSISREVRWALASQVLTSGANFLTTIIIVRSLGLEEFGRFSICFLLIMIVRNFLNGLVLLPMSTIGPKLRGTSIPAYRGFLAANGIAFALLSSLLLGVSAWQLGAFLDAPWLPELAWPLALANLASVCADYLRRYHAVFDAPIRAFAVDAVRYSTQLVVLVLLAMVADLLFSPWTALMSVALGGLTASLVGIARYGGLSWSRRSARAVWSRHWNFIKWMTPNVAVEAVQTSGTLLIGGVMLGETVLGAVRAMQSLANFTTVPFLALQPLATSLGSHSHRHGGSAAMWNTLRNLSLIGTSMAAVSSLVVLALGNYAIPVLYRVEMSEGALLLSAYLAFNLLLLIRMPLSAALVVTEATRTVFVSSAVGACLALAVVISMVPLIGGVALPLSLIASVGATTLLQAVMLARRAKCAQA